MWNKTHTITADLELGGGRTTDVSKGSAAATEWPSWFVALNAYVNDFCYRILSGKS